MRPSIPVIALALTLTLAVVSAALPVRAHEVFQSSEPAAGAVLAQSPPVITLRFEEPVAPRQAQLRTAGGVPLPLADIASKVRVDTVLIALPDALAPGNYVLDWMVQTIDHHPSSGTIPFTITAP